MVESKKKTGIHLICELEKIFKELSDEEFDDELFKSTYSLLLSTLNPDNVRNYPNIAEFFLKNKHRAQFLANVRLFITRQYSLKGLSKDKKIMYVSPSHVQWYDDGVMLIEGENPFSGIMELYHNHELNVAIFDRDAREGEELTVDDIKFVSIEEANAFLKKKDIKDISDLDVPLNELEKMLTDKEKNESKYQEWFEKYPWVLGLEYKLIQSHVILDDKNIPDFSGVRCHDDFRDVIEIKQPFLTLFRRDGGFTKDFNDSLHQIQDYLLFTNENRGYLDTSKGLKFENPHGLLIIGYNLNSDQRKILRNQEKQISSIKILTYNDLIAYGRNTIDFLKKRYITQH